MASIGNTTDSKDHKELAQCAHVGNIIFCKKWKVIFSYMVHSHKFCLFCYGYLLNQSEPQEDHLLEKNSAIHTKKLLRSAHEKLHT